MHRTMACAGSRYVVSLTIHLLTIGGCLAALGLGQPAVAQAVLPSATVTTEPTHRGELSFSAPALDLGAVCASAADGTDACSFSRHGAPSLPVEHVQPGFTSAANDDLPKLALDPEAIAPTLDLEPAIIEGSPTLQRWLNDLPDVADEIRHRPSFRTRLRAGYGQFPSTGQIGGFGAAIEDVFVAGTGLTASADYHRSWNGQRESYGAEARYYLLPLGGYVNVAPTLGYRSLSTPSYQTSGVDVGLRLMLVPSRGGGADLALSQRWVAPGTDGEVGITGLAIGYAVTQKLRLGTDFQLQNSRFGQDSRVGLSLELLL